MEQEVKLMKGNEAIAHAAIRYGMDGYFGYPITPQSEVLETLAAEKPWETTGMVVLPLRPAFPSSRKASATSPELGFRPSLSTLCAEVPVWVPFSRRRPTISRPPKAAVTATIT